MSSSPLSRLVSKVKSVLGLKKEFKDSGSYWIDRYNAGGNSGAGSYNQLAEFKAEVLNEFVASNQIKSVIEFGCGDGNQLRYFKFPHYLGFDISPKALEICRTTYQADPTKEFKHTSEFKGQKADLTLSLDVIYHLIEDSVFESYLRDLFQATTKYVIIYSSNSEELNANTAPHVKHRVFTDWVKKHKPDFKLTLVIKNKYPFNGDSRVSSFADFYIFEKV